MRFVVLIVMSVGIQILCDIMLCDGMIGSQHFKGSWTDYPSRLWEHNLSEHQEQITR